VTRLPDETLTGSAVEASFGAVELGEASSLILEYRHLYLHLKGS
jgi:hypothetical protein